MIKFLNYLGAVSLLAATLLFFAFLSSLGTNAESLATFEQFPMASVGGPLRFPKRAGDVPPPCETKLEIYEVRDALSCEEDGDPDEIAAKDPSEAARQYVRKYWPGGFDGSRGPHYIVVEKKVFKVTIERTVVIRSRPEKDPKYLKPPKCREEKK